MVPLKWKAFYTVLFSYRVQLTRIMLGHQKLSSIVEYNKSNLLVTVHMVGHQVLEISCLAVELFVIGNIFGKHYLSS